MHLGLNVNHNHSKGNCISLKDRVNDSGLAFAGKVGLGPFWTSVQVLSNVHVLQLFASTFVSSFRHERKSIVRKIYTRMQMPDLFDDFSFNQLQTTNDNHGVYG
jgi:hypothetical protein